MQLTWEEEDDLDLNDLDNLNLVFLYICPRYDGSAVVGSFSSSSFILLKKEGFLKNFFLFFLPNLGVK